MGVRGLREQNRGSGGAILTPNELVLPFGSYVCANFGENQSRNATVRVQTDGHADTQIHRLTADANRFYNLPHATCYSYGTDKHRKVQVLAVHVL